MVMTHDTLYPVQDDGVSRTLDAADGQTTSVVDAIVTPDAHLGSIIVEATILLPATHPSRVVQLLQSSRLQLTASLKEFVQVALHQRCSYDIIPLLEIAVQVYEQPHAIGGRIAAVKVLYSVRQVRPSHYGTVEKASIGNAVHRSMLYSLHLESLAVEFFSAINAMALENRMGCREPHGEGQTHAAGVASHQPTRTCYHQRY
eukprot:m.485557 g.485557  ORF g.485557 m.485557 type:complete len:202 (-) comp21736_c0_seq1:285-890(-)